jgi:hypothetical protein
MEKKVSNFSMCLKLANPRDMMSAAFRTIKTSSWKSIGYTKRRNQVHKGPLSRPTEASKVAACYDRNTSRPEVQGRFNKAHFPPF